MTEGKLYKNLRKMEYVFEFEARLDEAKAEFSPEPKLLQEVAKRGFEHATFQYLLDLHLKREAWFDKWFGASP